MNRVVAWSCIAISLAVVGRKQPSLLLRFVEDPENLVFANPFERLIFV